MGNTNTYLTSLAKAFFDKILGKSDPQFILVGLENAGKTVLLHQLINWESPKRSNLINNLSFEEIRYKGGNILSWDVGKIPRDPNLENLENLENQIYKKSDAIIFVVDSSDREKIKFVKEEFDRLMNAELLKDSLLLVLANKQDIKRCMSVQEVSDFLGLEEIKDRQWMIQGTYTLIRGGVYRGLDWISSQLMQYLQLVISRQLFLNSYFIFIYLLIYIIIYK